MSFEYGNNIRPHGLIVQYPEEFHEYLEEDRRSDHNQPDYQAILEHCVHPWYHEGGRRDETRPARDLR